MSRRMDAPGRWVDEGPQQPYSPTIRFTGSLVTPLAGKALSLRIVTQAERERIARGHAAYQERQRALREPVVRCGHAMPLSRQKCARRQGHGDSHRTQATMERNAAARRKVAA